MLSFNLVAPIFINIIEKLEKSIQLTLYTLPYVSFIIFTSSLNAIRFAKKS